MVKAAILGYGTIGSGVYEVLSKNRDYIRRTAGQEIEVKYICDLREFPGDPAEKLIIHDFNIIANDPEVEVVVETMGGVRPAYDFVKTALLAGKSVCTSNKELVAKHGPELIRTAEEKKVNFFFEASVGGGIPIIRVINEAFTSDEPTEIKGILNGTTNYILSKMMMENEDYAEALAQAQKLGYAERNPEADVEGFDACRKIAILTSLAYGKMVNYEDVHTEGITKISSDDIEYARALDCTIKLLGMSKSEGGKVYAQVTPVMVERAHPLFGVGEAFNAIFVKGACMDEMMFYGKGAGKLPTASAVVADVIDAVRNKGIHKDIIWSDEKLELGDFADASSSFFVRVPAEQKAAAAAAFEVQQEVRAALHDDEYAFITKEMKEGDFAKAAEKVNVKSFIRMCV